MLRYFDYCVLGCLSVSFYWQHIWCIFEDQSGLDLISMQFLLSVWDVNHFSSLWAAHHHRVLRHAIVLQGEPEFVFWSTLTWWTAARDQAVASFNVFDCAESVWSLMTWHCWSQEWSKFSWLICTGIEEVIMKWHFWCFLRFIY